MTKREAAKHLMENINKMVGKEASIVQNADGTYDCIATLTLSDISYIGSRKVVFQITQQNLDDFIGDDVDAIVILMSNCFTNN